MNKENSVENMNTKGVKGYESISWAPHPPPPPPPPPKKQKKKKKKIYGVPSAISSPTRTLLRQRYIGFAVPSFFFALLQVFKMYEKEDAPTERVKLLTLLSGEEDFELSRWDIHICSLYFSGVWYLLAVMLDGKRRAAAAGGVQLGERKWSRRPD